MWRKLSLLTCVVLVLGLVAGDAIADPNLVARWRFDETTGLTASDSSGNVRDLTLVNFTGDDSQWHTGQMGGALYYDGDEQAEDADGEAYILGRSAITIAMWLKADEDTVGGERGFLNTMYGDERGTMNLRYDPDPDSGGPGCNTVKMYLYTDQAPKDADNEGKFEGACGIHTTEWQHIAVTWASSEQPTLYVDGESWGWSRQRGGDERNQGYMFGTLTDAETVLIGAGYKGPWKGLIDDARIYDYALTEAGIEEIMFDPSYPRNPNPASPSENLCPGDVTELSWMPGDYAADVNGHDIYFGTSMDDVNGSATAYREGHDTNHWGPPSLELGVTYYWRVDAVNDGNVWAGAIWEFTTNDGNAFDASPAHLATGVPLDANLVWMPGCVVTAHDLYFGTDYNDVNDANATNDPNSVYKGRRGVGETTYDPCDFDYYTWHHWRIDEVNGAEIHRGEVWSFRSQSAVFDPNLLLWYEFEEGEGETVHDSSGHELNITDSQIDADNWEPNGGRFGGCLVFDDDLGLTVPWAMPGGALDAINKEITVAAWLNGDPDKDDDDMTVFDAGDGESGTYKLMANVPTDGPEYDVEWRAGNDTNDKLVWENATPEAWDGEWHHFGFVKNENEGKMYIYFDGFLAKWKTGTINSLTNVKNKMFRIGGDNWSQDEETYEGKMDDFRVYDYAKSESEIRELFRGGDVDLAWAPSPYNGEPDVAPDVNVGWWPGNHAAQHEVFFGTSWDDVNDMTEPCATPSIGNEEYDPGVLEMDTTYYWRIDEVNGPNTWKGPVWRFTIADFIILDDFELYDSGDNRIYYTWYDQRSQDYPEATGSWLGLATPPTYPVHMGQQAMSYQFDTDDAWADLNYAEAWLPLDEIGGSFQDWTSIAVRLLTVFFYGDADNDTNSTEQIYMGVMDTDGLYGEMRYGDSEGEDMNDLKVEEWQRWDVPFIYFSDGNFAAVPNDVDVSSIRNVYIGFGNKRDPVAAGKGVVYFDDLRLSMPFCKPEYGPTGDLNGDCFVGVGDIGAMGEQWLRHDINVNPVTEPPTSDPNLAAHWKLDGDANDSSANAYHGAAEGSYGWVAGKDGQAIDLSGGWVVVDDNGVTPKLRPKHYVSAMAWIYIDGEAGEDAKVVIKGRNDNETFGLEADDENGAVFIFRDTNNPGSVLSVNCGHELWANEWIHIAGTYDNNDQLVYVNGVEEGSATRGSIELIADANDGLGIGGRYGDTSGRFEGKIDDVRVYDRAVTRAEIAYIASGGDGLIPLESVANFYSGEDPEVIDFKDYATLFDNWGDEQLWPPEP